MEVSLLSISTVFIPVTIAKEPRCAYAAIAATARKVCNRAFAVLSPGTPYVKSA